MIRTRLLLIFLASLLCFSSLACAAERTVPLDKVVAIVNDDVITETTLRQQMQIAERQLQQANIVLPGQKEFRKQVLSRMIDVKLQKQVADKADIKITDEQVNQAIDHVAKTHHMTRSGLRKQIESEGMTFADYRKETRTQLRLMKLQQEAVNAKVKISDAQVNAFLKANEKEAARNVKYHVQNILIGLPEAPTTAQVREAKQKAVMLMQQLKTGKDFSATAAEASSSQSALNGGDLGWRTLSELPTIFSKHVKKMKIGALAGPLQTGNGFHIIKLTGKRGAPVELVTQVHVRQILIRADDMNSDDTVKARLASIRKSLLRGRSFAKAAEKYSQDSVSATKGGDLGWLSPGEMSPAFEKQVQTLQKHEISPVFKTQSGWHVAQRLGTRKVNAKKVLARQRARQQLYQQHFSSELQHWLKTLRQQAYIKVL